MDPAPPPRATPSPSTLVIATGAAAAGVLGMAALWTILNVQTGWLNGWATLLAAVDAALLLRLAGMGPGRLRALLGTLATALTVLLVGFLTASTRVGFVMGLRPLESAERMSLDLAWLLLESAARPWDWAGVLAGLGLGWWLSR